MNYLIIGLIALTMGFLGGMLSPSRHYDAYGGTMVSIPLGGTATSSFTQGWLYSLGGRTALSASSSPTVASLTATSTATSTFNGGLLFARTAGNIGIGTSTPGFLTDFFSTGTTSIRIDTNAAKGGCVVFKDSDGSGYTYLSASNGTLIASTNSCL